MGDSFPGPTYLIKFPSRTPHALWKKTKCPPIPYHTKQPEESLGRGRLVADLKTLIYTYIHLKNKYIAWATMQAILMSKNHAYIRHAINNETDSCIYGPLGLPVVNLSWERNSNFP